MKSNYDTSGPSAEGPREWRRLGQSQRGKSQRGRKSKEGWSQKTKELGNFKDEGVAHGLRCR